MPVDEFGREIPAAAFTRASPSPPRRFNEADEFTRRRRRKSRSPTPPMISRPRRQHPSERYIADPMLCEYVWKDQFQPEVPDEQALKEEQAEKSDEAPRETYDDYRRKYCLNYVRAFFNEHMDDSWFRQTYSPLELKRSVLEERDRATQEAASLREQVIASPDVFVEQARLGGGIKDTGIPRKRKYSDGDGSPQGVNSVPQSHVLSTEERTLALHDIPPYVTDEQLSQALLDHCSTPSVVKVFSASVSVSTRPPLKRSAYAILESPDVRKDILTNIKKANDEASSSHRSHEPVDHGTHVPRKDDNSMPRDLDLDVECSDPYGRLDVDEDGKGGGGDRTVPHRKCTVLVSTRPHYQPIIVLSVAVSSTERIARDKDAAVMLARALDVSRSIPVDCRLDSTLELLPSDLPTEDILDISIAYLRRVHLFSFYNGCTSSSHLGDVLAGQHPTGTIHLRLEGADDILSKAKEDSEIYQDLDESKATDLLVMRLDESISKALEESNEWVAKAGTFVDEERDGLAAELEEMEEQTKYDWIENHAIVDEDGRARCSFHFCRKLFKDDNFLRKHLMKKHVEFLHGEVAKCHDSFMMKAWDAESNRPVPPVLVDCGATFGLVPSPVVGTEPLAEDPEPELWRKEEEQRKRVEDQERYKDRREDVPPRAPYDHVVEEPRNTNRGGNFIDVDDMKEEKVELSFENVEVVVPPPKKKKKRKKLL